MATELNNAILRDTVADVRSFLFMVSCGTEDYYYSEKMKDPSYEMDCGKALAEVLTSKISHLSYEVPSLGQRVQRLGKSHEKIKGIWLQFTKALSGQPPKPAEIEFQFLELAKQYPKNPKLVPFHDTDLILFPDNFEGQIPENGITQSELADITLLYEKFSKKLWVDYNKKKFPKLNESVFSSHVLRNIRILLSRPLSRQLIREICEKMSGTLVIRAEDVFYYDHTSTAINFGISPDIQFAEIAFGDIRSILSPDYITFAHELNHLRHHLKKEMDHQYNRNLLPYYSDPEEQRTVLGFCECHTCDPINEVAIRREFVNPVRKTHLAGSLPHASPVQKFCQGARAGAKQDILDALPYFKPPEINYMTQFLHSRGELQAVINLSQIKDHLPKESCEIIALALDPKENKAQEMDIST